MGIDWGAAGAAGGIRDEGWEIEMGLTYEAFMFLV